MPKHQMPSVETLKKLLDCDFETGTLFWKPRSVEDTPSGDESYTKRWNARYAKKEAFTAYDAYGYKMGRLGPVGLKAHRVIYALHKGRWPEGDVDHINGVRDDNRIENLREASRSQNLSNSRAHKINDQSGYIGVRPFQNRWIATISHKNNPIHVGCFRCPTRAAIARDIKAIQLRGEFAVTNFHLRTTPSADPSARPTDHG